MEARAHNLSFSQFLRRRNSAPDVPEDVMDHFNDPNWDYSSSPSASVTSFEDKAQTASWTDHSYRSSDVESSNYPSTPGGASKLDLREAPVETYNE